MEFENTKENNEQGVFTNQSNVQAENEATDENVETQELAAANESVAQEIQNEQIRLIQSKMRVERQLVIGANWFIWIAGLSILNTVIYLMGYQLNFVVGLGATQFIDGIANVVYGNFKIIAFVLDIIVAGIFALFGVFAKKRYKWSFIIGMILYSADALIFIFFQDWIAVAFHVYALFGIFKGFQANNILKKINQ